MKKLVFILTVLAAFTACKKSDSIPSSQDLIIGKWHLTYEKWNEFYNNQPHIFSEEHNPSDSAFLNFTSNGLVIDHYYDKRSNEQGNVYYVPTDDTSFYTITNDQLRMISKEVGDTTYLSIQTLNSSTLSLYGKTHFSSDSASYIEEWYTLKK